MRVVFMGTPEFAVPSLRALAGAHEVVAAYSRPDSASGRGASLRPSAVKSAAVELGIEVRTPATLRDPDALEQLSALAADIIVVAAYGLILPRPALDAARLGAVNVHASLLPRWRGAAPIQRAILAGDARTGVSIMRMEEGLDTGPYCAQASLDLDDLSAEAATQRLGELGAELLVASLPSIANGHAEWTAQDPTRVTYADKIAKADVALAPTLTAEQFLRRVRASSAAAPARISLAGRGATVLAAALGEDDLSAGAIAASKNALVLGVCDGAVTLVRLKPDGKASMEASAWARGVRDLDGASWTGA